MTEQPLIIRPNKLIMLKVTIFPLLLIIGGFLEIYWGHKGGTFFFWLSGWVFLSLGCLVLLFFTLSLVLNESELRLTADALTMNNFFSKNQIRWLDITMLAPGKIGSVQGVIYDTVRKDQLNSLLMRYRKKRLGAEGIICNVYGLDNHQFFNLLNDYWERAKKTDANSQEGAGDEIKTK